MSHTVPPEALSGQPLVLKTLYRIEKKTPDGWITLQATSDSKEAALEDKRRWEGLDSGSFRIAQYELEDRAG